MKNFRIVVGILAVFPLALLVDSIFLHPAFYTSDSLGEMLYTVVGIPVLILNLWAWAEPGLIEVSSVEGKSDCHRSSY